MEAGRLSQYVQALLRPWFEAKHFVADALAVDHDVLHVLAGVLLLLVAAILLQRPVSSWRPWLVVLVLACLNELADLWVEQWPERAIQYGESLKDVLLTMLLPTLLLLTSRSLPWLYDRSSVPAPKEKGS